MLGKQLRTPFMYVMNNTTLCLLLNENFHAVNCTHGDIREPLLGGVADNEGLVEVCVDGAYYPVSLDNGQFSVREATAICKQLSLGNGKLLLLKITCHSIIMIIFVCIHFQLACH